MVVPAYNEEERIAPTLKRYSEALSTLEMPWEIIVVMDGVSDGTERVVDRFAGNGVRKLVFAEKLGKGGAVIVGLKDSRYDYMGYADADGSVSCQDLLKMVRFLDDYDCVIASRWVKGARILRREPLFNTLAGRFYNLLVRVVLFLGVRDTQCGAKFIRGEIGRDIVETISFTNRAFELSLLYHIKKSGGRILEVPVEWSHDERSRMPIGRAVPIMFLTLIGVRVMNSPLKKLTPRIVVDSLARRWRAV